MLDFNLLLVVVEMVFIWARIHLSKLCGSLLQQYIISCWGTSPLQVAPT
jgi:hypothetical protein